MKKDIGAAALVTPMPVCIVAAYDTEGKPNAMNAAWGINSGNSEVALFISKPHKTTKNIPSPTLPTSSRQTMSASTPATRSRTSSRSPACMRQRANSSMLRSLKSSPSSWNVNSRKL